MSFKMHFCFKNERRRQWNGKKRKASKYIFIKRLTVKVGSQGHNNYNDTDTEEP